MQYLIERPYWFVIFGALILITAFVCFKAAQASSKRYKKNEAIMNKLKEENILRNEFAVLTQTLIENAETTRLFKGVALNLQKKISDTPDMRSEFDKFTAEQKEIYAISFVIEDGEEKLSGFFRANGQPVTGCAYSLFKKIFSGKAAEIFEKEYNAFDEDNEETSLIPEEIKKYDAEFSQLVTADEIRRNAGNFIKENKEKFI
ncbi:MAG: hypothetical protein U0L11_06180 [Acutalibacteraceae bacterium]|nr:hypothetical protein [Acutalibacteraceae bacterium]